MISLALLAICAFFAVLLVTPLVRNMALRYELVDNPDLQRKFHAMAVPRLGGVAIAIAYVVAFAVLLLTPLAGGRVVDHSMGLAFRLGPAAAIIFGVGLLDDLRGLSPKMKLLGQLLAAGAAYVAGINFTEIGGFSLPVWAALPLTMFWLVLVCNATNLIDGMDGLATGLALFATLTMLSAALLNGNFPLAMATVPLAGALLGFLRYNFNPATIFLGDCGSLSIGFLLGCFGIIWSQKSTTVLGLTAPLIALAIPLLDVVLSILRRFLRRRSIFGADRGHIHHRLLDRGLSVRQAALVLYGVALVFAILSMVSVVARGSYAGAAIVVFCLVTWVGIQRLGYVEISMTGRLLLTGGFRRALLGRIALRGFIEKMEMITYPEEGWDVVRNMAKEMGFSHVVLQMAGRQWEYCARSEWTSEAWTAEIPLSDGDWIRLSRPFGAKEHESAMAPFLETLREVLIQRRVAFGSVPEESAVGA